MRRSRVLVVAPAAGLSLLLGACGGTDEPDAQASETAPPDVSPGPSASASASAKPSAPAADPTGLPTIALASTDFEGRPAEFGASDAALSGDGNFLAYRTPTAIGTPAGAPPASILVRDLRGTSVVPACTTKDGDPANAACESPSLSHDGAYVAFTSAATNLVGEDKNPNLDVFRKDLRSGEVVLVSTRAKNAPEVASTSPSISADGRTVAFATGGQIVVKDLADDVVTLVSRASTGAPGDAASELPKISADASTVAFRSRAANLAGKPRYTEGDVLVAKVKTGKIVRLEKLLRLKLPKLNYVYEYSAPTRHGSLIAYTVIIDTLEEDEDGSIEASTTNREGVFVADLNQAKVIHTVRTKKNDTDREAGCPALSADGKFLAYCTFRLARKATKGGDGYVVYLADLDGDNVAMMSGAVKGTDSPDARSEAISADGKAVAFRSDDSQRGVDAEIKESRHQFFVARPAE